MTLVVPRLLGDDEHMKRVMLLAALAACGGGDDSSATTDAATDGVATDAAIDAPPGGGFTLSSPMLAPGAMFAAENTCNGANTSPQLAWTPGPAGTLSYAVVLTDKSNNLTHWVIYDIPASATGLPANVEKVYAPTNVAGAHQTTSYQSTVRGYLGPCPPVEHTYELVVHALDAATLPGADMTTSRAIAIATIDQHRLGMAALSGTYKQP